MTYSIHMSTTHEQHHKLAHNIETLRQSTGRTKKYLYDAAGISQSAYDRRIRGDIDFRFYEIVNIAKALDTTVSELTGKQLSERS